MAKFPSLVEAAKPVGLELSLAQGGWSGSDHMVFNTREVPVLFLFGGAYPQYNRPSDVAESLDPLSLESVTTFASSLMLGLRTVGGPLDWVMVGEKELRTEGDPDQNRKTWLGTLPDFTEGVSGYKLAGVFDESPAARAGLQKGDVLTSLGGQEIADLATFTRALRTFGPGDLVEITADREGRHLKFTVVLGARADRK
jgi:membrane-associated protease RseP (regulator of RpoE activity)